tara:strand:- start:584 stop:1111 length:528 start_codon:yes stop_codon:yes gene_type:complete
MDTTEIIIITIALVLLIVALFTFNYFMTSVDKDLGWPPYESPCPDFWTDESEGVCFDAENTLDLSCVEFTGTGTGTAGEYNYTTYEHPYLTEKSDTKTPVLQENGTYKFTDTNTPYTTDDDSDIATNTGTNTFHITSATYAYFDPDKKDKVEMKNRKQWAKRCGLTWSGVTNTNH